MLGGPRLKARTQCISALVSPSSAAKEEQVESGFGSSNSVSDDSFKHQRAHTAKSRKHRRQTPLPTTDTSRPKSVLYSTYSRDPVGNYRRLTTASSRISIDAKPFQEFAPNHRQHNNANRKQICSNVPTDRGRHLHIAPKKQNDDLQYSDDWSSDYSDDWELDTNDIPKPTPVLYSPPSEAKLSNNSTGFVPCDPTAFEASFCRQRQVAIDNMSYRQAINSSKAKTLHDVVQLILDLSSSKSLIDRAWLVFYWVSQNIEYDVEAYFSGNIKRQTSEDVFANRKGVCDAFGTIFETLCNAVQIECKKIGGYAKGYSFKLEQATFTRTNHAWNAIRLNGHWYLVDSTWGTGHLNNNKCNQKELDPFYFLARPEQMIYMHLPEDPQWQLLASPVSMHDFVRLPSVYPTFFELDLDIISPRHSSMASFNSSLGLAEVLVRAPFDTVLMGDIEQAGTGKIRSGNLVQYDADRQVWQCLFAPQFGGFHTLTIFGRREKRAEKRRTNESSYYCVIQLGLHVPAEFKGRKTFPLTYGLFTASKCQIFEPLDSALKPGSKVTIHCRIPGAFCARLKLDGNWLPNDLVKGDIFKRQITVPQREVIMYVQFSDKQNTSSYDGLFSYSLK